jgi:hypothetical protein
MFHPASTTSLTEPMDQGVTATFKLSSEDQLVKDINGEDQLSVMDFQRNFNRKQWRCMRRSVTVLHELSLENYLA